MDLRQIRYFLEVAESGSFNVAAARLHVSQSSLSRRVKDLETELGTQLLERDALGARLTDVGRSFLARTKPLVLELELARQEVVAQSAKPFGAVTVGTSSTFSRTLLGHLAESFDADYPRLRLRFVVGAQYALYEAIDAGHIDLAVMISPDPIRNCIIEPLIEERLNLVSAERGKVMPRRITIGDFHGLPLLMFPRPSGIRTVLDEAAANARLEYNVRYELADVSTHLEFAHRGLAYAILSRSAIRDNKGRRSVRFTPIEDLSLTRALVHRVGRMQSPAVKAVADAIRFHLRKLVNADAFGGHIRLAPPHKR